MYTEEPRREINWGSIIKKGLLILLIAGIIFLVIWLFTRNNSNGINVNYEGNNSNITNNNNSINSNTYSEIFIDNYRYFHDTAKEYYLISNLPKKGETLKFTLQELINKQLILPFSYTSTESCDTEASYVSVKNNDGKYTMTTTLVCGTEVATTKEELGCNQLCIEGIDCDCNCNQTVTETEKVTEYQYKQPYQATETTYSCPSGYTKTGSGSNTKCVKTNSETVKATKTTTYTCKDGYTKTGSGENTKCIKENKETIDATKKTTYSCPSGYKKSGSGSNTKCYKYSDDKVKADYDYEYSCPSGYTRSGSKCTKTVNATASTTYSCPSGYTKNGSKCTSTSNSTISATATTSYSCPSGYTRSGSNCTITTNATSNISYSCPSGYNKEGNSCIKYLYTSISYGSSYNGCTGGQLVNSGCSGSGCSSSKYVYKCTKGVSSATTYSCPSGYTKNGSTCTKTISATASTSYTCPSGYTKSGSTCTKSTNSTIDATATTTYTCSAGYTKSGSKCIKTTTADKEKVYYCSDYDYELDGKYCYTTTKVTKSPTKTTTYTCPTGYTKTGSGSNTKCTIGENDTIKAYKSVNYTCASGYTKSGTGSTAICTKGNTATVKATKSTKSVTKYRYKWSTATSLDGWTKTGETRQTTTSSK